MNLKSFINSALMLFAIGGTTVMTVGCGDSVAAKNDQSGGNGNEEGGRHEHGGEGHEKQQQTQKQIVSKEDADKLYVLVKQARSDLRTMRQMAGLHTHAAGTHVDPGGHHEGESEADRERERSEREGHEDGGHGKKGHPEGGEREHGDRESKERGEKGHREVGERERGNRESRERGEGGEHGEEDNWIPKLEKHVHMYENGGRWTLQYNPSTKAFVGSVVNTTKKTLSQVRVEVHLSNGVELGPTKRTDLKPGATLPVELSAVNQKFTKWVTHPEAGFEEGHGAGGEHGEGRERRGEHGKLGEGRGEHGEHGEGGGRRPRALPLRPVYNQLQLLRGEMRAFSADIKAKKKQ